MEVIITESKLTKVLYTYLTMSFEGFDKKRDGLYESANYATAATKIHIKLNGGLSSFKVKRY
jgi:hypothetical protein